MTKKFDRVYQFKITLNDIKPTIWRRIQVPETYTFWDLHVAIQDSMGWMDYHLHQFEIVDDMTGARLEIGIPGDEFDIQLLPGWEQKIAKQLIPDKKIIYLYDFGDGWEHDVKLEKILPKDPQVTYPICLAGQRACPPEDCGGPWGYENFLEAINNVRHEDHEEMLEWIGGEFHPEEFNPEEIVFDDPAERLKRALE